MPPRSDRSTAFAGQNDRQVIRAVLVAILHRASEENHRVIQQSATALLDALHLLQHVNTLSNEERLIAEDIQGSFEAFLIRTRFRF